MQGSAKGPEFVVADEREPVAESVLAIVIDLERCIFKVGEPVFA